MESHRFLADTQLLLWSTDDSPRLSTRAISILTDRKNRIFFSPISLWEVGVKRALGRSDFIYDPVAVRRGLLDQGFEELPFTGLQALGVVHLAPIHRDPFDRILLAQALVADLTLLTSDKLVASYPGNIILV